MEIKRQDLDTYTVLSVEGPIMIGESTEKLERALSDLLDDGVRTILIDFSGVNYIDSTGLGELVGFLERIRHREGKLALVNPQDRILQLLKISGLDKVFPIYSDLDTAIQSVNSSSS